ncbi:MAG: beta strand repeat-containing protein [Povalibacter sp.]
MLDASAATINGRVFEDVNYGGGAGRSFAAASGIGIANVTIEIYQGNTYVTSLTTSAGGVFSYTYGGNGARTLRVVNGTVRSSRNSGCTTCVPVQTYRTTGSGDTALAVTDHVGGENPALNDAAANSGSSSLSSLANGTRTPQSIATFVPTTNGSVINNADFGFNFDTIVTTRDDTNCTPSGTANSYFPCQGTLRQFIINSNALTSSISQSGSAMIDGSTTSLPFGPESSIFMIPDGTVNPGQGSYASQLTGGIAVITLAGDLPQITDASTRLDATTQTVNVGNTNTGTFGSGGTVGALGTFFPQLQRPEVQVSAAGTSTTQLTLSGSSQTVIGFSLPRATLTFSGSTPVARNNLVGVRANGTGDSGTGMGVVFTGSNALIQGNYVAANNSGIRGNSPGAGATISFNEVVRSSTTPTDTFDGILLIGSASSVRIENNLTRNQAGAGIELGFEGGSMSNVVITNNTVRSNGFGGSGLAASAEPAGIAGWNYSGSGVEISLNRIENNAGPGVTLSAVTGTRITQNSFSSNGGLAIDLYPTSVDPNTMGSGNGPTLNDTNDADTGANGLLNFPVISAATIANGEFSVAGFARPGSVIELFIAQSDPSGFGEGLTYIGAFTEGVADLDNTTATYSGAINGINQGTDNTNRFLFRGAVPAGVAANVLITSTATLSGQTSEFGGNVTVTGGPNLLHTKSVKVESDPLNNALNPKSIPGSIQLYTVRVANQGAGTVDNNSLQIIDSIPTDTILCNLASIPVTFLDGTPASGLAFTFTSLNNTTDDVDFSNTASGSPTWTYTPSPTAGCDANVRAIRIRPHGVMAGSGATGNPYFDVQFRVKVN